ncbi:MAG: hypothetical protein M3Y73_15050 [Actinomycetota bacterium]|nr:hypothetical protein [Actinomycetota bacterium]
MSDTYRRGESGAGAAAVMADPAVMLVRYRAGLTGQTARTVHLVSLRDGCEAGVVGTLCGSLMSLEVIETVTPGRGMPCSACVMHHVGAMTPAAEPRPIQVGSSHVNGPDRCGSGGSGQLDLATYQAWGWPVTQQCDQIRLSLECEAAAIAIPIPLSTELIRILAARHCASPVLAHPDVPEHHIMLAGERYGVTLPWPPGAHQVAGALMLPPTMTPRGPITWIQPPNEDSLRSSREIDIFGVLRSVVHRMAKASAPPIHAGSTTIQVT